MWEAQSSEILTANKVSASLHILLLLELLPLLMVKVRFSNWILYF